MQARIRGLEFVKVATLLIIVVLSLAACSNHIQDSAQGDSQTTKIGMLEASAAAELAVDEDITAKYIAPEVLVAQLNKPVNDFTSTLSSAERQLLDDKLLAIDDEGLLQMGVVIVSTTGEMPIFDYAMTVAKGWALGSPDNNNGLLILLAVNDRKIYILTGLDVEGKLTDERIKAIIDKDITPHFPENQYATGLSAGIEALVSEMRQYS